MPDEVLGLPYIAPMLATPGAMPRPADEQRWAFEMKWDGVRAIAYAAGGRLALRGRSGRDFTSTYPELSGLADVLDGRDCVLDGEVVAFDEQGRPSFEALQSRMHGLPGRGRGGAGVKASLRPVAYLLFDLLYLDGMPLLDQPYAARRETLSALGLAGPNWQTPPTFPGMGADALDTSARQQLEGVVAKRLDSRYEPGRRSPAWIKVKHLRTQEVVIGGWRIGEGSRAGTFGSLLCGVHERGRLMYAGRVGTGFTQETLAALAAELAPLARATSPFDEPVPTADARDARWVEPVLVGEVAFALWTRDGRLWHPSWRGLRADKDPRDVVREP
ncbi:non-homologous end-joining DNA ligase [Actinopolymorpha alba]|uniref:non-homologous end-joining DNA ligase n=1 Tax=Actinopolymorpha alba TaxID=533267 RepID=UPI0003685BFF|nr:non-homologous end-joining DNA ligase [Actinopolymorpha alba]